MALVDRSARAAHPARQGSITLADERLVAGAVEYEMESKNKHELRTGGAQTTHSRLLGANVVDVSGAPASHDANHASSSPDGLMTADSLAEQLAIALSARGAKVVQLFQEWDASGDGHVDKAEFARALSLLGLPAERALSDALFDAFDVDGSGKIEYRELHSMLRKHAAAVAAARDVRMAERDAKGGRGGPDRGGTASAADVGTRELLAKEAGQRFELPTRRHERGNQSFRSVSVCWRFCPAHHALARRCSSTRGAMAALMRATLQRVCSRQAAGPSRVRGRPRFLYLAPTAATREE